MTSPNRAAPSGDAPRLRIVHETDPEKYLPALFSLARHGSITLVSANRYSVAKEWLRAGLRGRVPIRTRTARSLSDASFRLRLPRIKGDTVVLAFAPWDWRILIYGRLARHNRVIYQTSWPRWQLGSTPRQFGPLNRPLRSAWLKFLRRPSVTVVTVLDGIGQELLSRYAIGSTTIPHAVPAAFFEARKAESFHDQLRLIYVGELSKKKGIRELVDMVRTFDKREVTLTIVGDGPLREYCRQAERAGQISYMGPVNDRQALAEIMADHDVLMLLSKREPTWEELFGIVVVEAMAAGLGVIASDHTGPTAVLGGLGVRNLIEDGDSSQARAIVAQLAANADALAEFRAAHSAAADRYRMDAVEAEWLKLVEAAQ